MTHLEALNTLIAYYSGDFNIASCEAKLNNCIKSQQRRPYSLPPKPRAFSFGLLLAPVPIFILIGLALVIVFGLTGLLSRYYLFGYVHLPAMKLGYFILSLFGGESVSDVTVEFVREWCRTTTWSGAFAMLVGYAGGGLALGILFSFIKILTFNSDVKSWKKRCEELTPERFEEEETERIEREKKRQPQLESELLQAKNMETSVRSIINELRIPNQYLNKKNLTILRGYILSGRAYTVADAINCAIQDQWRDDQARVNREAAQNAEEARDYAKRTYDELHRG